MPDIKSLVAGGAQGALGIIQNIQANKLKKQANESAPPLVDPTQASFLSELNQKRASLDAGTAFAAGINNINATNAGTNEALVRSGGGDVGGTIQALLQSQRATNDSKNQLLGQGQQEQNFNNTMYGDLLNKVAARRMQLQLQKSQQLRAEWAQKQQGANQNIMAGIATMTGGMTPKEKQPGMDEESPMQKAGVTSPVSPFDIGTEAGEGASGMGPEALPGLEGGAGGAADLGSLAAIA